MQFCRAVGNRGKFPVELGPAYKKDSTDLFRQWLDSGKDFMKVLVRITRGVENTNLTEEGWGFKKVRDLGYSTEKKTKLLVQKKAKGH